MKVHSTTGNRVISYDLEHFTIITIYNFQGDEYVTYLQMKFRIDVCQIKISKTKFLLKMKWNMGRWAQ